MFQVLDKLSYISLLLVGLYFIYQGQVIYKYNRGWTDFYEYRAPITEWPTMLTFVDLTSAWRTLKYGEDFNISLNFKILKLGKNSVENLSDYSSLNLHFEELWDGTVFKITPLDFPSESNGSFTYPLIQYVFKTPRSVDKVNIQLTTPTGGLLSKIGKYGKSRFNSDDVLHKARPGNTTTVLVSPSQKKYLKRCQALDSSNEIQLHKTLENVLAQCDEPCKPSQYNFGQNLSQIFEYLPKCNTTDQSKCFMNELDNAKKDTMNVKPCQKMKYFGIAKTASQANSKMISFIVAFAPPQLKLVKEEYLIYDAISFISSVGGTIGLCVGFSFYSLCNVVLQWVEKGMKKITGNWGLKNNKEIFCQKQKPVEPARKCSTFEDDSFNVLYLKTLEEITKIKDELRSEMKIEFDELKRSVEDVLESKI